MASDLFFSDSFFGFLAASEEEVDMAAYVCPCVSPAVRSWSTFVFHADPRPSKLSHRIKDASFIAVDKWFRVVRPSSLLL